MFFFVFTGLAKECGCRGGKCSDEVNVVVSVTGSCPRQWQHPYFELSQSKPLQLPPQGMAVDEVCINKVHLNMFSGKLTVVVKTSNNSEESVFVMVPSKGNLVNISTFDVRIEE